MSLTLQAYLLCSQYNGYIRSKHSVGVCKQSLPGIIRFCRLGAYYLYIVHPETWYIQTAAYFSSKHVIPVYSIQLPLFYILLSFVQWMFISTVLFIEYHMLLFKFKYLHILY